MRGREKRWRSETLRKGEGQREEMESTMREERETEKRDEREEGDRVR